MPQFDSGDHATSDVIERSGEPKWPSENRLPPAARPR